MIKFRDLLREMKPKAGGIKRYFISDTIKSFIDNFDWDEFASGYGEDAADFMNALVSIAEDSISYKDGYITDNDILVWAKDPENQDTYGYTDETPEVFAKNMIEQFEYYEFFTINP